MRSVVMKFGGTSVGDVNAISQMAEIVRLEAKNWDRMCIVISAMSGVTDGLIDGAVSAAGGDQMTHMRIREQLQERHYQALETLLSGEEQNRVRPAIDKNLDAFEAFCKSIEVLGEVTPRAMDVVSSLGEKLIVPLAAGLIRELGIPSEAVDSSDLIITGPGFSKRCPTNG